MTWINCSSKQNKERDICRFRKSLRGRYASLVKDIKIPKNAGFWATIPVEKKGLRQITNVYVVAYKLKRR